MERLKYVGKDVDRAEGPFIISNTTSSHTYSSKHKMLRFILWTYGTNKL